MQESGGHLRHVRDGEEMQVELVQPCHCHQDWPCRKEEKAALPPERLLQGERLVITVCPVSGWPASLSEPLSCPPAVPAVGHCLSAPPGDSSRDRKQDRSHREMSGKQGEEREVDSVELEGHCLRGKRGQREARC